MPKPRKPMALHISDGTYRPDRMGIRAEPIATGTPVKPVGLDGEASAYWDQITPLLIEGGAAREIDSTALAEMCEAYALYRRLFVMCKADPTNKDTRCACTAWFDRWDKLAGKFGLTPQDRTKISTATPVKPAGVAKRKRD